MEGVLEMGKSKVRKANWEGVGIVSSKINAKLYVEKKSKIIGLLSKEKMNSIVDCFEND